MLAAGDTRAPHSKAALARLCERYWPPLYAYVRRRGYAVEDAQDLTQEFFARLIEKDYLKAVDRGKGRFRTFLLTCFERFLANDYDRSRAQKRGGGHRPISLDLASGEDAYLRDLAHGMTPDKLYDKQWALTLLEHVLRQLRGEYVRSGKGDLFDRLKSSLTVDEAHVTYSELAAMMGMSEGAVKVSAHRLRKRYRELLRAEIALTVAEPQEVDDELRLLFAALGA